MQRLADRASAIFVPTVLALAALTFTVWSIAENTNGHHEGFARALSIAIAVLIIACPCAMGLAVPAAITVSLGRAAQSGLLIKGGEALERLATVDTIALDKTGTLTEGRPRIAAFVLARTATLPAETLLSLRRRRRTPLHPPPRPSRRRLLRKLRHLDRSAAQWRDPCIPPKRHEPSPTIENLITLPGTGLTATIANQKLALGNAALLTAAPPPELLAPTNLTNATPLYLLLNNIPQAVFFATDELRPTAPSAIAQLNALHIHPVLLTGDIAASATPIAHAAGITDIQSHLLPAEKLAAIRALQQPATA